MIRRLRMPGVAYVLPRAADGSWYQARALDPLTDSTRRELAVSLDQLAEAVQTLRAAARPGIPLVIAGFSQGACVVLEYALKFGAWHGALVCLTGCRVGTMADDRPRADLAGMPVYFTNSDADAWIPLTAWAEAVADIGRARGRLRAELFPGRPHEVSDDEIAVLDEVLSSLTASPEKVVW